MRRSLVRETYPRASNTLRLKLYQRAKSAIPAAVGARKMLASLELARRERDRPAEEYRHPDITDGSAWTEALRCK
jgi:hypothetical protein